MFKKNVDFEGPVDLSPWRKIAIGTWRTCGDPSVYGTVELDATALLTTIEKYKEKGIRLTPTIIISRGLSASFKEFPTLNSVLRWGRLYQRKTVDIFLQVSSSDRNDDNLSGILIRECDKKSLADISDEIKSKSSRIKRGDDIEYKKMKGMIDYIPSFLVKFLIRSMGFLMMDMNIWSPLFNSPRDSFGSAMVTSVGMLGIDQGFAPLVPYSRCPALFALGEIKEKAVVEGGKIVIKPMLSIGVTLDHRLIDGKGASFMLKAFREYMASPV